MTVVAMTTMSHALVGGGVELKKKEHTLKRGSVRQ
jgi:hypothetical protein